MLEFTLKKLFLTDFDFHAQLEKVDIVFLQEVNLSEDEIRGFIPGYDVAVNMDDNNPSKPGTAILWKKNLLVTDVCSVVSCRAQVATLGQLVEYLCC